jgi:hypothetical protein
VPDNGLLVADKNGRVRSNDFVSSNARIDSAFKKKPGPIMGDAFGDWLGRDLSYLQLPGGAVMQFDLNRLVLNDFRAMKDHYQINANLTVLSFMMHQLDWHIECESQKIADQIESNIRDVWTQLVHGTSQAYWAGYSPMAIHFETNPVSGFTEIDEFKDLVPEDCRVHWDHVEGWAPPGHVKPKFRVFGGINQIGKSFPIPPDNCVTPDTPILCADLTWRQAGDLEVGDRIVAFDEDDVFRGRCYRTAEIVVNNPGVKSCVSVQTDLGDPIVASLDHPFLVRVPHKKRGNRTATVGDGVTCLTCTQKVVYSGRGRRPIFCSQKCEHAYHLQKDKEEGFTYSDSWEWRDASTLQPGDQIAFFGRPWELDDSRSAGWLAGMFDGEGCLSPSSERVYLSVSQNSGVVLDKLKAALTDRGFAVSATTNTRDTNVQLNVQGGRREIMRFLATIAPSRFMQRDLSVLWEGSWIKINKSVDLATVGSITPVGDQPVASIQTSSGTFITGGYLSHNSLWYPCLRDNGDMYGRKLLRPAFPSWFFSILIHLFSNRYFERFGEPLAIGRADFDHEVTTNDGRVISGKNAMEMILMNLRNRSVVVLPSDRDPNTKEYDFDLSYLESQMRGADFERYMGRLDEEMSIALFTPILLFRTADVGSYNLGMSHMQVFQWSMNSMAGDLAQLFDKTIIKRLHDFNWTPKAPKAYFRYRSMGKDNDQILNTIVEFVLRAGNAAPDLVELGKAVGMSFEEIQKFVPMPAGAQMEPATVEAVPTAGTPGESSSFG